MRCAAQPRRRVVDLTPGDWAPPAGDRRRQAYGGTPQLVSVTRCKEPSAGGRAGHVRSSLFHSIFAINQTERKRKIHAECPWNSGRKHHWVIRKLFVK